MLDIKIKLLLEKDTREYPLIYVRHRNENVVKKRRNTFLFIYVGHKGEKYCATFATIKTIMIQKQIHRFCTQHSIFTECFVFFNFLIYLEINLPISPNFHFQRGLLQIVSQSVGQSVSSSVCFCQAQPSSSPSWAEYSLIPKLSSHPTRPDPTGIVFFWQYFNLFLMLFRHNQAQ